MKQLRLLILGLVLTFAFYASSATYFCSPTGSGNGSSYTTPSSLANGLKKLSQPGDTLYLLGGQYDLPRTNLNNIKGNAQQNIVISGYPGETAIMDFRQTPYGERGLVVNNSCQYLHIKQLTLRYSGKNNLICYASYCRFEQLDVYGSADTGVQMKEGGNNLIINVDSHDNFDYQNKKSGGALDYGGNADGFADKQHSGAPNHYIGCRAWGNSDDGWDFYQRNTSAYSTPTIIENCICYQNGPATYDMTNHPRRAVDQAWFNSCGENLAKYTNYGNGNGFKVGGDNTVHNVLVHHSLAVGHKKSGVKGFDQNNNAGHMDWYNCTAYDNRINFGLFNSSYGATTTVRNCVSYRAVDGDLLNVPGTYDHDSWNISGLTLTDADFVSTDVSHILDARKEDGSYADQTLALFAPSAASALIDQGINVGYPFAGQAPDLGWQEYGTIVTLPSVVCLTNNADQYVVEGDSIQPIVFKWGGKASKLSISPKPAAGDPFAYKISNGAHTLTLTGHSLPYGTHTFTITTVSDTTNTSLTATIHVRSANARRIGYLTIPGDASDTKILEALHSFDTLAVSILDASVATYDYTQYDLIIAAPAPSSSAAAFPSLKTASVPQLVLKPFLFKSSVWGWGTAENTALASIDMPCAHEYYSYGVCWQEATDPATGTQTVDIFSDVNQNGLTQISSWSGRTGGSDLVQLNGASWLSEFAATDQLGGAAIGHPLIMIGISEYSTAQLTHSGQQIVCNLVFHLLGMQPQLLTPPVPTAIESIHQQSTQASIDKRKLGIYSIMGHYIGAESAWESLPGGIYIVNGEKRIR